MSNAEVSELAGSVAIIGMAGRFPSAANVEEFWQNLRSGVESISHFSAAELEEAGVEPSSLAEPGYVRAKAVLEGIELFDAAFFGLTPREAETMDPQQRFFLECAWEALERAGYDPDRYPGPIGVYAGVSLNSYLLLNLWASPGLLDSAGILQASIRNRTDHLTTRVAYKLNLRGPAVTLQTACSTSLVAVHTACQGLLNYQCDMALAGGVTIGVPKKSGYLFQEGGVLSPDGHCRAFDAAAQGTVVGNGVGLVVLKRLEDALRDGDHIHAVIRGTAVNNDGSDKVGYTAPSVSGQAEVIATAQAVAGIPAETISYVEAHGTGTPLGDPIEVAAITQVFRASTDRKQFCALGSVKTNIGHLDAAAGVAGLIKTALALEHRELPPSLNFERPNPEINFADSPFYVNAKLSEWRADGGPRRAGVSSFGIGGTNAHAVLEEAPLAEASGPARPHQLLVLSARTATALEAATANLGRYLKEHPGVNLADVAYTLHVGRKAFARRRILVCRDAAEGAAALDALDPRTVVTGLHEPQARPVAFMFTGQGAQYAGMGAELYETEPTFRRHVDECAEILGPLLGLDLRGLLFPGEAARAEADERLRQTALTQPALFTVEYALAKLWEEWGVRPAAMIGHSIGEYVAACLAGVFTLEDALKLVAERGRLMQSLPPGAMLSVSLSEKELLPLLGEGLSLAAVNSPALCVAAGPAERVGELEAQLVARGVACRRLVTSHAFHSQMMEPILDTFRAAVAGVRREAPRLPFVSNLSGGWITEAEARDPNYWVRHLRETVRFGEGVTQLFKEPETLLVEVGPGRTLMTLARWHPHKATAQVVLTSLPRAEERGAGSASMLHNLGRLWLAGVPVNWDAFYARARRRRLPLPTYPFERQRYWVEPPRRALDGRAPAPSLHKKEEIGEWFYFPVWKRTVRAAAPDAGAPRRRWLLFADEAGLGERLAERLVRGGHEVTKLYAGERFAARGDGSFTLAPSSRADYDALFEALGGRAALPNAVVHLWGVGRAAGARAEQLGFYSLLALAQSLGARETAEVVDLAVVTSDMQSVTGEEVVVPEKALALGPCKVIPQEFRHLRARSLDVTLAGPDGADLGRLAELVEAELAAETAAAVVAFRRGHRWTQDFEQQRLAAPGRPQARLREGGVYFITGGLGGVGLTLAEHLARTVHAKLVLVGRAELPARADWLSWLASHGEQDEVSRRITKLLELESLGAEVLIESGDVTDPARMREIAERARRRFGPVHGVIHAAGVPAGGMIALKTPEAAAAVCAPKTRGARVLEELFAETRLDFMLLCSSRASVLGGFGQIDYSAANAFLDAFAHYYTARHGDFCVSVDWDGWQEVGMLVRTAARYGVGAGREGAEGVQTGHPLLGRRVEQTAAREVYVQEFSLANQWILDEHRIGGTPVLPGVTYLEMARAAFEPHAGGDLTELRDVFFITPLSLKEDERREVRFELEKAAGYSFRVSSRPPGDEHSEWQDHAVGRLERVPGREPRRHDLAELLRRCSLGELAGEDEERDPDFGPRWQNLRRTHFGRDEWLVLFELDEVFESDLAQMKLHPSLLDRAAGSAMLRVEHDGIFLPFSYKRLTQVRPMPRRLYSHIRLAEPFSRSAQTMTCDITVMDESGVEILEIEGFSHKRINDIAERIKAMAGESAAPAAATPARADALANFYEESLREGIAPREGAEAFARILAGATLPQVVVSTKDLRASAERAVRFTQAELTEEIEKITAARPAHPRPNVRTPYVAPRDATERTLAEIMQELLGIEQVGVEDNFFELGGDSVLSIQVIARAARAGLQITPQQIFQHQTIAELTAALGAAAPAGAETREEYRPAAFELAGLDESELGELSALLGDDGGADEDEEAEVAAAPPSPAPVAEAASEAVTVEGVLRGHPLVREAVAVRRNGSGPGSVVAYVVLDPAGRARTGVRPMEFSLFYFAADNARAGGDKYRLYLEGARFADRNGLAAIWTPERHFHASGGLYPSPAVLSASLATVTERIHLRAGSVVAPLHHSLRVAEDWAVVDNLSRGRVGVSFTSGWIPNDFAFFPDRYAEKREAMFRGIEEVRRLWRGEAIEVRDGVGKTVELKIFPRPVQPELPVWLTCSGDPEMFKEAGARGFNVLTALLTLSVEELAPRLALYREARERHGHDPAAGQVALMLHTFVGADEEEVIARTRGPLSAYLKEHVGLIETMTKSLDIRVDIDKETYLDHLVAFAYERYYRTASLIGTPEKCHAMVKRLREIGVDEVACFIDFGVETAAVLDGLRHIDALRQMSGAAAEPAPAAPDAESLAEFVRKHLPTQASSLSVVLLESLPLKADGGVDYQSLPTPNGRAS